MGKHNWKKILISILWVITGIGTIVLLGAAIQKKNRKSCTAIKVEITGVERHMFIDEEDVMDILHSTGKVEGSSIAALNLRFMEQVVESNAWVKNAEMFLDNNQVLQVRIEERQPVARVFTLEGSSFYLDSSAMRLPLSEKLSARVPVFTGFPSDKKILAAPDSALLQHIVTVGKYILADSFWMAQVAQIDITPQASFEMVPVIGDHIVTLGDASELDRKFRHLYTFYKEVWLQNGINAYEKLDVQYNNQVVAVKKGTQADSAKTRMLMDNLLPVADSGHAVAALVTTPSKDSVKTIRPKPAVKLPAKRNSVTASNNKAGKKALTNEKKQTGKKIVKKKPAGNGKKPKAILNKPK